MLAVLQFTLPEESEEFNEARKGSAYHCALLDMDNYLRSQLKYRDLSEEVAGALQDARNKLIEFLHERDITLY